MKRKILALAVASVMAVGLLAGCGGNGGDGGDNIRTGDVTEVTIGMITPLTGGAAQFGTAVERGAMLYIERFNALGGLQIRVNVWDDEGTNATAVTGFNHLLDQNVTAILGAVTSGPTRAIVPLAYEANMPMITATATHENVTVEEGTGRVFTNMFRSCFIDPFQGQKMAEFAHGELEAQTVAVLYSHEIAYSVGLYEAFVARAAELGMDVVAVETFPDEAIDFRAQLTNIARENPDVLFIPAYYRHIGLIGPQSVESGVQATLIGADGWATIADHMVDTSSIEGAYFLTGFSPEADDPLVREFIDAYQARHGNIPNMFAAQAYDAAKILISAIEATIAGTNYTATSDAFRTALIANMAATDLYGVTGRIVFNEFNNPEKTGIILRVTDGREAFWGYF